MNGRHRLVSRRRRGLSLLATGTLVAGLAVGMPSLASPASAVDGCTTPELREVMVSQGLPSYTKLTRGKSALARFFFSAPACLPAGLTLNIKSGSLTVSSSPVTTPITSPVPLPQLGPLTAAPISQSAADPYFVVPGALLNPPSVGTSELFFSATFDFDVKRNGIVIDSGRKTFDRKPGTTSPIAAAVEGTPNPLRVLVVPMGDLGTLTAPKTAASQFPAEARTALQRGMESVSRVMPVRDGISDLLTKTGGLQYTVSGGMIDLSRFMPSGAKYCGVGSDFGTHIEPKLNEVRNAWNKENPAAVADRVLGVVWQGVSRGPSTDENSTTCLEGFASFSSGAAWSRLVDERTTDPKRSGLTGSLAVMELAHTVGDVPTSATNKTRHSLLDEADETAPNRAYNLASHAWIAQDRSAQKFRTDGTWNDDSTLLEKASWDYLQCFLTSSTLGSTNTACPSPGGLGGNAAASADRSGSFFLAGRTDGTPAGTSVDSYFDDNVRYEPPVQDSAFRLVQRDALGRITVNSGVGVSFEHSRHDGANPNNKHTTPSGTFGTELESDADTVRIEFWKGNPASDAGAVLLYSRNKDVAPQIVSVSVAGSSVSLVASDDNPQDLRLYAHHVCPTGSSPILTNEVGTVVGRTAVFVQRVDTSASCPNGTLLFTIGDGYLTASQADLATVAGGVLTAAAIYEPSADASFTVKRTVALAGAVRDRLGREVDDLRWYVSGPGMEEAVEVARGARAAYVPSTAGLTAGLYTLQLKGFDAFENVVAMTSRSVEVLSDKDFDGIADKVELAQSCYPAGVELDPSNAVRDTDLDGVADANDGQPCVSTSNIAVDFNPNSFNTGSAGNTFSAKILSSPVDLRTLPLSAFDIQQVGGYVLGAQPDGTSYVIRPVAIHADTASTATVKFDRSQLAAFMQQKGITGTVPVFIGSTSAGLRGVDTIAPGAF